MAKGVRHLKTCAAPGRPSAEVGRDLTGNRRLHMPLTLISPAFSPDGTIPTKYTCDGDETSPPLEWSGVPDTAMSLALIVQHSARLERTARGRRSRQVAPWCARRRERLREERIWRTVPAKGAPPLRLHAVRAGHILGGCQLAIEGRSRKSDEGPRHRENGSDRDVRTRALIPHSQPFYDRPQRSLCGFYGWIRSIPTVTPVAKTRQRM